MRALLRNTIADLTKTETLTEKTRPDVEGIPAALGERGAATQIARRNLAAFQEFRKALAGKENLDQLDHAVAEAFAPLEQHGLLAKPTSQAGRLRQEDDLVYPVENPAERREVDVREVVLDSDAINAIKQKLAEGLNSKVHRRPRLHLAGAAASCIPPSR